MDRWNRKDQNTYTGMNVQRRNRRKPDMGMPVESEETAVSETADGLERWLLDDEPRRETRGTASVNETTESPEGPALVDWDALLAEKETDGTEEPESPAPEAEEEKASPAETVLQENMEAAETPELPEKPDASAEDKTPEKPETSAEPETAEETPAAVQGADSRVPPEARRMSAAPYGTVRPEARRPGTRPQNGYRRPPVQEQKPVPVRPRRDVRDERNIRNEAQRPAAGRAPDKTSRVRVGYAPGRMSDGMTQQLPVRETAREAAWEQEQIYSRDAKAYLEKRSQPFRTEPARGTAGPDRPEHKLLRIVVALLIVAGIVIMGIMIARNSSNPNNITNRQAPRVLRFVPPELEKQIPPVDLAFQVDTERDVDGIRLRGENNEDLDTEAWDVINTDGSRMWTMKMHVETGYTGTVVLQVRRAGEEQWYNTDYKAEVNVQSLTDILTPNPEATPEPVTSADAEDDDYYDEDAEAAKKAAAAEGGEEETQDSEAAPEETQNPDGEDEAGEDLQAESMDGESGEEPDGEENSEEETDAELPAGELRTPVPTPTVAPPTPAPTEQPPMTAEAVPEADPGLISSTTVYTSVTKKVKNYSRPAKELIHMPEADEYAKDPRMGLLAFRGDNFRRNAAVGTLSAEPIGMKQAWDEQSGSVRGTNTTYYGYGWTGQPVIAHWSKQVREGSNLYEKKTDTYSLKEVIIAGMDGNVRFIDLKDGEATRNSIKLGYPMRGTPSLHTNGSPFMSVGQFARKMKVKTGKIGLRQYNLYTLKELKLIDGLDGKYHRPLNDVGSFETSALIDRTSDTLIAAGSNGMLYLESLNSSFDYNAQVLTIEPSTTAMNYKVKGQKNTALLAIESSPAAYDRYVYMANMGGVLMCIDTNVLKPVWAVNTGDSVMAAVALDLRKKENDQEAPEPAGEGAEDDPKDKTPADNRELNLYTANMLNNRKKGDSDIQIRRYDAMSGREIWKTSVGVYKGKKDKDDVGAKASPVIGQHGLDSLVYFTVTGLSDEGRQQLGLSGETMAALIALEKESGRIAWSYGLSSRSESSPIAVYDEAGNGWIVQCEQNGTIHLVEGLTGNAVSTMKVEGEIEASPAAYGNMVVIGTTGKNTSFVYGIELEYAQQEQQNEEVGDEEDSGGA